MTTDRTGGSPLGTSSTALSSAYDVALLDLDGVVYVGPDAVPDAPRHLETAAASGMTLAFVTNNASRPPAAVAAHLRELGIAAQDQDVVTSAQAAATLLADELDEDSAVFVIGGEGLVEALEEKGLRPVSSADEGPSAVVSGFSAELRWGTVVEGAILVRDGVRWVASNTDRTVPTPRGPGPGNGVLVAAVRDFSGVDPTVAGKPETPLFDETVRRVGGDRPLVVGDRVDTDIDGARNAGMDSLLVLTGVTGLQELVAVAPGSRPTYLAPTLSGLNEPHPAVVVDDDGSSLGGWRASVERGRLVVSGAGRPADWWRVVAASAWRHLDDTDELVDVSDLEPPS